MYFKINLDALVSFKSFRLAIDVHFKKYTFPPYTALNIGYL